MGISLQEETGRERCETSSFYRLSPQIPASLGFTQGSQQKQHTHIYIYIYSYIGSPFLVDFGTGKMPSLSFTKSTSC